MRRDGRKKSELRKIEIIPDYLDYPEGSCLITVGKTKVICAASFEEGVPPFLEGKGKGWVTSEYSMLPRATQSRSRRESTQGKIGGRTHEIQRLIGRSLRSAVDPETMGENTIWIDCDVIQADGGTRTAAITGSYVALALAFKKLLKEKRITYSPLVSQIAAVSVGLVRNEVLLDLDYSEDSGADLDMNIVMNRNKKFIEIQGTSEKKPASKAEIDAMIDLAWSGLQKIFKAQDRAIR